MDRIGGSSWWVVVALEEPPPEWHLGLVTLRVNRHNPRPPGHATVGQKIPPGPHTNESPQWITLTTTIRKPITTALRVATWPSEDGRRQRPQEKPSCSAIGHSSPTIRRCTW